MVPVHLITALAQTENGKKDEGPKESGPGQGFVALLVILVIVSISASLVALATAAG